MTIEKDKLPVRKSVERKTPDYKRIKRAEEGRDDWKMKAIERREENEKLKHDLSDNKTHLTTLFVQNKILKDELDKANKKLASLEKATELLKKKPPNRG